MTAPADGQVFDVDRPTWPVPVAAAYLGVSERSLRRQVDEGQPLAHLAIRIGSRVVIRTQALLDLVRGVA